MTPQRQEMGICNGHFSLLLHASLAHYMFLAPTPLLSAHTWNRSQINSSTLSAVRQLLSLLVTSSAPATAHCSSLSGLSSIIPVLHTAGVITLLVVSAHDSHLYSCWCAITVSLSAEESSFCCWSAVVLSAHQGAIVLVVCRSKGDRKMEA